MTNATPDTRRLRTRFADESHQYRLGYSGALVPSHGLLLELIRAYGLEAVDRAVTEIAARASLLENSDDVEMGRPRTQMAGSASEAVAERARRICDDPDLKVGDPRWSRCVRDAIRDERATIAATYLPATHVGSGGRLTRREQMEMLTAPATFREVAQRYGTRQDE